MARRSVDPNLLFILGGVGVVGYLGYQLLQKLINPNKGTQYEGGGVPGTIGNALNQASGGILAATGSAIGGKLYDWINPNAGGLTTVYVITFPDGSKHAINPNAVSSAGTFMYDNKVWKIHQDGNGVKVAVRA